MNEPAPPEVTPELVYERVWKPVIEKDGELDPEAVKGLLADYALLLNDVSMLYTYLTEGQITHPQDSVEDVIEIADNLAAESIDLGIRTVLDHLLQELESVATGTPEEKLMALVSGINSIYEYGGVESVED